MIKNIDMKRIKYIILTIFVITTFSCGDDFLKKNPLSFLSPENTYVDAAGLTGNIGQGN